jgi:hypothetical protein
MKRLLTLLIFLTSLVLLAGCTGNDDQAFKSLVEQLNQKGLQTADTIKNADGSFNKAVMEDMVKTYTDARGKMTGMTLSDTYSGARDNYVKGIDEALAGYSALLNNKEGTAALAVLANAGAAMQRFSQAQSYFDSAKRMIGVPVT